MLEDVPAQTLKELNGLEVEFSLAELELLRQQVSLFEPLYTRRDALLAGIPHFWPTVLEQCEELEPVIEVDDADVLQHLTHLSVTRSQLDPREFSLRLEFAQNEYLSGDGLVLEKQFRRPTATAATATTAAAEGATGPGDGGKGKRPNGKSAATEVDIDADADADADVRESGRELVSDAVPIHWAAGRDLTGEGKRSFFDFFSWTGAPGASDRFEDGEEVAMVLAETVYPDALRLWTDAMQADDDDEDDEESIDLVEAEEEENEGDAVEGAAGDDTQIADDVEEAAEDGGEEGPSKKKQKV